MNRWPVLLAAILVVRVSAAQPASDSASRAARYLADVMDQFHQAYDVYTDVDAAGNHFAVRARMSNYDNTCRPADAARTVPPMDEGWTAACHTAPTCIRAAFRPEVKDGELNWGAWYFMNGIQRDPTLSYPPPFEKCPALVRPPAPRDRTAPQPNWGNAPDAGIDLTGATELSFYAKGEKGGERVEFFALGVGWNPDDRDPRTGIPLPQKNPQTGQAFEHPDASPKATRGYVPLTKDWRRYSIPLRRADLQYVLGGFGWASAAVENEPGKEIVFYIDDIRYELDPARKNARLETPRFLVSYRAKAGSDFDRVLRNAAYTYDNALALLAFLAVDDRSRARQIADAFVLAQSRDRFRPSDSHHTSMYDGSIRNAYQAGDLLTPPGWTAGCRTHTARMPGWYEKGDPRTPVLIANDIKNPTRFAQRLLEASDALSVSIRKRVTPEVLRTFAAGPPCGPGPDPNRKQMMADELNRVLTADLDRRALEAAYPEEIERIEETWLEDSYFASLDAGNMAWAMLALLAYHEAAVTERESQYLTAAIRLGEWIVRNCDLGDGLGYAGGYNGFEPDPAQAYYKSTEHNIDLHAAFERLHRITGNAFWHTRALQALAFVRSMWNGESGMFWTGTTPTGETNTTVIPLDIQPWAILSLRDQMPEADQLRALAYAEQYMRLPGGGYDYSRRACTYHGTACRDREGVWYEGTAQMAAVYRARGDAKKADEILAFLRAAQRESGAMTASDNQDGLPTGFMHDDDCVRYFKRAHVGASAWLILAERGTNPFWMGHPIGESEPKKAR